MFNKKNCFFSVDNSIFFIGTFFIVSSFLFNCRDVMSCSAANGKNYIQTSSFDFNEEGFKECLKENIVLNHMKVVEGKDILNEKAGADYQMVEKLYSLTSFNNQEEENAILPFKEKLIKSTTHFLSKNSYQVFMSDKDYKTYGPKDIVNENYMRTIMPADSYEIIPIDRELCKAPDTTMRLKKNLGLGFGFIVQLKISEIEKSRVQELLPFMPEIATGDKFFLMERTKNHLKNNEDYTKIIKTLMIIKRDGEYITETNYTLVMAKIPFFLPMCLLKPFITGDESGIETGIIAEAKNKYWKQRATSR